MFAKPNKDVKGHGSYDNIFVNVWHLTYVPLYLCSKFCDMIFYILIVTCVPPWRSQLLVPHSPDSGVWPMFKFFFKTQFHRNHNHHNHNMFTSPTMVFAVQVLPALSSPTISRVILLLAAPTLTIIFIINTNQISNMDIPTNCVK